MKKQIKDLHIKSITNKREEAFLNKALEYKNQYNSTPWWRFKKRHELYKNWQSALDLMVRFGNFGKCFITVAGIYSCVKLVET